MILSLHCVSLSLHLTQQAATTRQRQSRFTNNTCRQANAPTTPDSRLLYTAIQLYYRVWDVGIAPVLYINSYCVSCGPYNRDSHYANPKQIRNCSRRTSISISLSYENMFNTKKSQSIQHRTMSQHSGILLRYRFNPVGRPEPITGAYISCDKWYWASLHLALDNLNLRRILLTLIANEQCYR